MIFHIQIFHIQLLSIQMKSCHLNAEIYKNNNQVGKIKGNKKGAFEGISDSCIVEVPEEKYDEYKNALKGRIKY